MKRSGRKLRRGTRTPPDAATPTASSSAAAPSSPPALVELGLTLRRRQDYPAALAAFHRALLLEPRHPGALAGLVGILGGLRSRSPSPEIERALLTVFASPDADYDDLGPAAAAQLRLKHDLAPESADADAIAGDPLFAAYLEKCVNTDPVIELFLTALRRNLLLARRERLSEAERMAAAALGRQCFANEYVFLADDDERRAIDDLADRLAEALAKNDADGADVQTLLLLYCLYRPLSALPGAGRLADTDAEALGPGLRRLVQLTLRDHLAEQALKAKIETLGDITDPTSRKVRTQYEESPYPRWLHAPAQPPMTLPAQFAHMFPHAPRSVPADPLDVLIAGSGTGRQVVRVARTHPDARILAIDLSKASLAYAMRMAAALGLANVRFMQADILDLGRLDDTFDMVQSVGVLHHMKEPLRGWRALVELLRPGGVMKVGLYSERGRRAVQACRRLIAAEKIAATPDGIARLRQRLIRGPRPTATGADFSEILATRDFYSTSMCRDLLFHVHERHTTPKRLKRDLKALGLEFVGFELFEEAGINAAYRQAYPSDRTLANLDNWDAFEAREGPLTDLYLLWCRKPAAGT